jgi:hypothetical protein
MKICTSDGPTKLRFFFVLFEQIALFLEILFRFEEFCNCAVLSQLLSAEFSIAISNGMSNKFIEH